MRDLDDEKRIREYMAAKMKHIKMYNECMNLADGLDVERFAKLVRADEREACAQACEDLIGTRAMAKHCADAIRARGEK